jgi:hypothetical protein
MRRLAAHIFGGHFALTLFLDLNGEPDRIGRLLVCLPAGQEARSLTIDRMICARTRSVHTWIAAR